MSARNWIREHALLSGAVSGLLVAGVTGISGYLVVEFLGVWSQHQDGNAHVTVVETLEEISSKLDAKPDQGDLANLVTKDYLDAEFRLSFAAAAIALRDVESPGFGDYHVLLAALRTSEVLNTEATEPVSSEYVPPICR